MYVHDDVQSGNLTVAEIVGLPQSFLTSHSDWHLANPDPNRAGYGISLLDFHRDLVNDVLNWMRANNRDTSVVQPWPDIPAQLKTSALWSPQKTVAENRILNRRYSFRNLDDFGQFLVQQRSDNLHGFLHRASEIIYADNLIAGFSTAPRSTHFYNIHGLIQQWRLAIESQLVIVPRTVDWAQLLNAELLFENDVISAAIQDGVLTPNPGEEAAVDFVLSSQLRWGKWLNVPDGETGSSWTISTGASWFGRLKSSDSVSLWAHQVNNGQALTFSKAKGLGQGTPVYVLGGLSQLKPNSRVTFTWMQD